MLFLQFPVTHTVISHLNDNKETENQLQKQIALVILYKILYNDKKLL